MEGPKKFNNRKWPVSIIFALAVSVGIVAARAEAQSGALPIVSLAASSEFSSSWAVSNANDGNLSTDWSSWAHLGPSNQEWIAFWFDTFHTVNYVKLYPRHYNQTSLGFPVSFNVDWFDGSAWQSAYSYNAFPTPTNDDWVILPLPSTVTANGIRVLATQLGKDDVNNYILQFAEVGAGYDPGFTQLAFVRNDSLSQVTIENIGSGRFDPNKISNWNYDEQYPLIKAQSAGDCNPNTGPYCNIYAANVVWNGVWNIYFGGYDGTPDKYDRISFLTTPDFVNFPDCHMQFIDPPCHVQLIDHGDFANVNNESVLKLNDTSWLMYYTTSYDGVMNHPGYATSYDGAHWIPSAGSANYLLNITDWNGTNINGTNVGYFENGTYYFYFRDSSNVHYATSSDGINYPYSGVALAANGPIGLGVNDVKSFMDSGNCYRYYLMGLHYNSQSVWYSISRDPTSFPPEQVLFNSLFTDALQCNPRNPCARYDKYIVSVGFVTDGTRLYGALYGASPVSSLDQNSIYAIWLQKKVLFSNNHGSWGDSVRSRGPDQMKLNIADQVQTGRFSVYDTDGSTLLFTSPPVTIRPGDHWRYSP